MVHIPPPATINVDEFYRKNNLRLYDCPGDLKHPAEPGYPTSCLKADKIQGREGTRYCWLHDSRHLVLDVDTHEGGENGLESLQRLSEDIGVVLTAVCEAILLTPTGGMHLYFLVDDEVPIQSLTNIRDDDGKPKYPGIDTLGRGIRNNSLTIGAGSTHPTAPGLYRWDERTPSPELVYAPDDLVDLLTNRNPRQNKRLEEREREAQETHAAAAGVTSHTGRLPSIGPGTDFQSSWRGVELLAEEMAKVGYLFRLTSDEQNSAPLYLFRRPEKASDSKVSGYLGRYVGEGTYHLTAFTHSDEYFPEGTSITILEALCRLRNRGDGLNVPAAARDTLTWLSQQGFGHERDPAVLWGEKMTNLAKPHVIELIQQSPDDELWNYTSKKQEKGPPVKVGRPQAELINEVLAWDVLKRIDRTLFVVNGGEVQVLDGVDELFAWLHTRVKVNWAGNSGCVTKGEFYRALRTMVPAYDGISAAPHYPPVPGILYLENVETGDEADFWAFVDHFRPRTEWDRRLIAAAVLTVFWGEPGGKRPAFAITSPDHQGSGKSTLVNAIARLAGMGVPKKTNIVSRQDFEKIGEKLAQFNPLSPLWPRIISLDNFKGAGLCNGQIESYVTEDTLTCRRLYQGDVEVKNHFTWFISGNAMSLSEDLSQRAVEISLLKPKAYNTAWEAKLAAWDVRKVISGIAAVMERAPVELHSSTRFGMWCEQIVGRVVPDSASADAVVAHILDRSTELSISGDDAADLKNMILSLFRAQADASLLWKSHVLEDFYWMSFSDIVAALEKRKERNANGKPWNSNALSRGVKTHDKALEGITIYRTNRSRGVAVPADLLESHRG